jgi:hypothetical protein
MKLSLKECLFPPMCFLKLIIHGFSDTCMSVADFLFPQGGVVSEILTFGTGSLLWPGEAGICGELTEIGSEGPSS